MILPLIERMENTRDIHNKKHSGIVDLVLMDGASNVQKGARILAIHYPCITVGHGAKHVVNLLFQDVYTHTSNYVVISCVIFCMFHEVVCRSSHLLMW